MKLTVHFEGKNKGELITNIEETLSLLTGGAAQTGTKSGTKAASKKEAAAIAEEEIDLGEEEAEETESEFGGEEDEETKEPTKKDVNAALKKFSAAPGGSRKKAMAVLAKYKATGLDDLDKKYYAKIIEALT